MPDTAISWKDVTDHAPELSGVLSSTATNDILTYVNASVLTATWGNKDRLAAIYLASHIASSSPAAQAAGASAPVASEAVGSVSYSYAIAAAADDLDSTAYGRAYKQLRSGLAARLPLALTT